MSKKHTPEPSDKTPETQEIDVAQVHASILRERVEPRNGFEPVPIWLVTLIMVLVLWAGLYLGFNSGGFKSDVYDAGLVNWSGQGAGVTAGPDPMVIGKKVFTQSCVVCHQSNGEGLPGQFPPLAGSEWVLSESWHGDNHLVKLTLLGLQGPIEVKGAVYNGAMPGWSQLTDVQISAVLTYIRNEWGNQASAITPDHVKQIREELKGRTDPLTQDQLKQIPPQKFDESAGQEAADDAESPSQPPA